ncbi:MAG: glycosyltransferase [Tannerella sp.]|jgi:3-hydroxymyristoyl/3-hydroxydecanoyl-(acyl carrier protein) dehydratase|nr:glycosyltransferase [Tannerella sp.]
MILKDNFYTVEEQTETGNGWICRLSLNASHPIYRAHFPGHPVTPGVCIIQLTKEIASGCYAKSFFLSGVKNVKFLRVIDPLVQQEMFVHLLSSKTDEQGRQVVSAAIKDGETVVFSSLTLILEPVGTPSAPALQERMELLRLCVVIPTYNNDGTLADVLRDVLRYTRSVIVVNDGATDRTGEILQRFAGEIDVVSYAANKGKGYALKRGFERARESGYQAAVTMDSDGQHDARDLEVFIRLAETCPGSLLIGQRIMKGQRPSKNSFANKFSNFWFLVHTGRKLQDTQNGFRLYPLAAMKQMRPFSSRYEAELELLVRSAWKGLPIHPAPVHVYYAPDGQRVTHFRPGKDFLRISLLNTLFTFLAVIYGYPRMICRKLFPVKPNT